MGREGPQQGAWNVGLMNSRPWETRGELKSGTPGKTQQDLDQIPLEWLLAEDTSLCYLGKVADHL